jgi:hypothetical protein
VWGEAVKLRSVTGASWRRSRRSTAGDIAGVDVELRSVDRNVILAKTITDGQGHVTFPDVPAGRYTIRATRPGFVPTDSP